MRVLPEKNSRQTDEWKKKHAIKEAGKHTDGFPYDLHFMGLISRCFCFRNQILLKSFFIFLEDVNELYKTFRETNIITNSFSNGYCTKLESHSNVNNVDMNQPLSLINFHFRQLFQAVVTCARNSYLKFFSRCRSLLILADCLSL